MTSAAAANAETGGDSIDVGTVGGDLKLETGGGNISIGSVKGKIQAETGGGNVVVLSGGQGAVIEAGGGNVEIKQLRGESESVDGRRQRQPGGNRRSGGH